MGSSLARLSRAVGDSRLVAAVLRKLGLDAEEDEEEPWSQEQDMEEARGGESEEAQLSSLEQELTRYDLIPPGEAMPRSWKVPPALILLAMYLPRRVLHAGTFFPWRHHVRELQHVVFRRLSDGPFAAGDRLEAHFRNICLLSTRDWSPDMWDFLPRVQGVVEVVSRQLEELVAEIQGEAQEGQGSSSASALEPHRLCQVARALEHGWRVVVCPLALKRATAVPSV